LVRLTNDYPVQNPFHPAPGALPGRILGRETELAAIREAIRRAGIRQSPTPAVIVGQRGMGKTVLLRYLRELAGDTALAVPLPNRSLGSRLREKVDQLLASVEPLPDRAGKILRAAIRTLPKVSYELPHDGGAVALEHADDVDAPAVDHDSLIAMLTALRAAARAAHRFLAITIDEIQDSDLASIEVLATFVHESAQGETPVLLAVAGLNETRELMDKLRTYVHRWNTFELRLLTFEETLEAIRDPIVAEKTRIDEDALYLLARESGGYPYFIQAYGSASWEAHRGRTIALTDVENALPAVRSRNEMSFYIRPLSRLSPREMLLALTLARLGPGVHDVGELARELGVKTPDISSTRGALVKKHIVSSPMPGKIEFRIPFTDRFLRDRAADFETPEVERSREDLKRGNKRTRTARQ
jgi:type II secretory pathway predicted ATPase ExeA